jgi:hypothetical protein
MQYQPDELAQNQLSRPSALCAKHQTGPVPCQRESGKSRSPPNNNKSEEQGVINDTATSDNNLGLYETAFYTLDTVVSCLYEYCVYGSVNQTCCLLLLVASRLKDMNLVSKLTACFLALECPLCF